MTKIHPIIGAEYYWALDFLAPGFYRSLGIQSKNYYFSDAPQASNAETRDPVEELESLFGADDAALRAGRDTFSDLFSSKITVDDDFHYELVKRFLLNVQGGHTIERLKHSPTLDEISSMLATTPLCAEIPLKTNRSSLRLGGISGEKLINISLSHVEGQRDAVLLVNNRRCNAKEAVFCAGSYALLKSAVRGFPGYLPWYLKKRDGNLKGAGIAAITPFEPIYSMRINRERCVDTLLAGGAVTYGFLWHCDLEELPNTTKELFESYCPNRVTRAICDLIVRGSREESIKLAGARSVFLGLVKSKHLKSDEVLNLLRCESGRLLDFERSVLELTLINRISRNARRTFFASPSNFANLVEENLYNELRNQDWVGCQEKSLFKRLSELLPALDSGTNLLTLENFKLVGQQFANIEREIVNAAVSSVLEIWAYFDVAFRWSALKSVVLNFPANPSQHFLNKSMGVREYSFEISTGRLISSSLTEKV